MTEFERFDKIPRFRRVMALVTEKIDGTNAQIYVPHDPTQPLLAGSRSRWITPESDNYGFARFVHDNSEMLRRLGPGRHYGEWYGAGIQRRYGLEEKRLALFNVARFRDGLPEGLPANVALVPTLHYGSADTAVIESVTSKLYSDGSIAVPGWKKPEGVIVQVGPLTWKVTDAVAGEKEAA